ncbi:MAG: DUF115 domain-containing protein [Clostridiales bacterium]|jgi:hypothetical protein|nr:DUF115 domain-containing protein [Clostridiales bacterium]
MFNWKHTEGLLEKNIRYIENSKKIFADISKLRDLNEKEYQIIPCADRKGYTIEKMTGNGIIRMHSAHEPEREGRLLAEKIIRPKTEGNLYIHFGFGFGYLYKYLLPILEKQNGEIIVYEPSYEVFNYFIRLFDISQFFTGYPITLFVHDNADEVRKIYPYITRKNPVKTGKNFIYGYGAFFNNEIKKCIKSIKMFFISGTINLSTIKRFGNKWAENTIINFPHILESCDISGFFDVLKGKPAIIVAAGPSLNKNVHLLKEVQGKVFIGAVYTSVKTLERNGIKPDFFVAMDAGQFSYEVGEDYNISEIPMVLCTVVSNEMFKSHKKNNFIYNGEVKSSGGALTNIVISNIGKKTTPSIPPAGSVAYAIAELFRIMGASTIILLGQDLAYTGGQHHAKEHLEGQSAITDEYYSTGRRKTVEDINGEPIESNSVFEEFLRQYQEFAEAQTTIELIDATEGGAKIPGTKIMTFRDAIDTYMKEYSDPNFTAEILKHAWENGTTFDEQDKKRVIATFEKLLEQCGNITKLISDALIVAEKVKKQFRFNRIPTAKEIAKPILTLKEYDDKICQNKMLADALFAMCTATIYMELTIKKEDEPQELFYARITAATLTLYKESCDILAPVLEETIAKMKEDG